MDRGDIWHVELDPVSGREQAGARYALIISPTAFNKVTRTPLCVPITGGGEFARKMGFAVSLTGCGTRIDGVILCHQIRTLDLTARNGRFVEKVPAEIVDEVLRQVSTLLE
jgi:mRNA-degrading endonuclease toxin of MazEF toxin-antitoxin module